MDRNPALPERKKNDTRGGRGTRKTTTNRRSEINRQRERASSPAIPPDMDYDAMLAMQLAEENDDRGTETDPFPDPDADLNQLISNFGKRSRQHQQRHEPMEQDDPTMSSGPPGYDELAAADEDMIPCEFCGETFPAFAVVHHQSVCDPLASGLWGQGPGFGRNNEPSFHHRTPAASRPPAIPVINNLGSASPAPDHEEEALRHLSDNGDFLLNSLENIMLPCEFCNDLLPADSLVQHQAMCERVPPTPRVMTPAAAQPSSGIPPATERSLRSQFFPTSTSTSRYQPQDPTEELMAVISRGGQDSSSNVRPKKKPNVPRGGNPWENSGMSLSVARPQGSRPAQRRVNQGREPEDEQDIPLHGRRGSRPSQPRMDSANRIRHTLNSLLSDEGEENQGVAGAGGAVASGPGRRSQGSQKKTTSARDTGVSSRTVIRSLQQGQRQSRGELTPGGEGDLNSRRPSQRERGDHVFNNPGSQRNPASQTRSRRNQDRQPPADWE